MVLEFVPVEMSQHISKSWDKYIRPLAKRHAIDLFGAAGIIQVLIQLGVYVRNIMSSFP